MSSKKKRCQKSGHLFISFERYNINESLVCESMDFDVANLTFVFNLKSIFIDGTINVLRPSLGRMFLIHFECLSIEVTEFYDFAIVAGGDGSVSFVANILMKSGQNIPLGIIPAGTCNDFAK